MNFFVLSGLLALPLLGQSSFWVASLQGTSKGYPAQTCLDAKQNGIKFNRPKNYTPLRTKNPRLPKVPKVRRPQTLPPIYSASGQSVVPRNYMPQDKGLQAFEGSPKDIKKIGAVIRAANSGERIRLSFFGASHTGGEYWTGHIRRVLQNRYGDIGHGFTMPVSMFRAWRGTDINLCSSSEWFTDYVGRREGRKDSYYGLGMVASSQNKHDFAWLETTRTSVLGQKAGIFDVFTLSHAQGGALRAQVDLHEPVIIPTYSSTPILQHTRIELAEGQHRLSLSPMGDGEVRLFGVSVESPGPGVLVDAIGIRGREARTWLKWDKTIYSDMINSLDPNIIVLAYGTNEANDTDYTANQYRRDLRKVLQLMRQESPDVSCILAGPSDRGKQRRKRYTVWGRTRMIANVQREVAPEFGCVFWDWQQATGGEGSMIAWRFTKPPLAAKDLIHFSAAGYIHSAEKFIAALDDAAMQY